MLVGSGLTQAQTVVFLSTDTLTATRRTVSGARSVIRSQHSSAALQAVRLDPDADSFIDEIAFIKSLEPDVIVTVGSAATQIAKDNFDKIPIIFSAVKYPVISGFVESNERPGSRITGASLDIPVDIQFRYFSQIIPGLKRSACSTLQIRPN